MRKIILFALLAGAVATGCGDDEEPTDHHGGAGAGAHDHNAVLAAKSGNTTLAGMVTFSGAAGAVTATITVTGAPPGQHGVHIHETGDCSDAEAMNAGGHWNPSMQMHGPSGAATSHFGDMGNLEVKADGTGTATATNPMWQLGSGTAMDVVGKAVIVHAMPDDLTTQPTGNAGGRIGCGVIQ
jgi:Cu-Zn family superoxide dismutase